MDKCDGGELFAQIVKRRRFPEKDAAFLCHQMLNSIEFVHRRGIVHRDIKAENFLFSERSSNSKLILIDFGMSTEVRAAIRGKYGSFSLVFAGSSREITKAALWVTPLCSTRAYKEELPIQSGYVGTWSSCLSNAVWKISL